MVRRDNLDPRLPLVQDADLKDKVVLVRMDHNVVKKGEIRDPYRIDATLGTLYHIVEQGGRPIIMTHVGRPYDKKTGTIKTGPESAVQPVVEYLERKLHTRFVVPQFRVDPSKGILDIDTSINLHIRELRDRRIGGVYMPNTRWFAGEEMKGEPRDRLALQLAGLADVYVNDAFGSWQPHASTFDITKHLPSFAGFLMQKELENLKQVLEPERPFVAVVAGSKYDTKIGPLSRIYEKVDHLILGGVIYNTFLCARYGFNVAGVEPGDIEAARQLVELDRHAHKIVELPNVVESDVFGARIDGQYRTLAVSEMKAGKDYGYLLDVASSSFMESEVARIISGARTIFVNAVMGLTPLFFEGSAALDQTIDKNTLARKLYGGGDTLQEFKSLAPGLYLQAMDNASYYFFTGGGTVLKAIEEGTPYGLEIVKALMSNAGRVPA